ncbi:MAG: hypothetical protein DHS20C05_02770 [Hyphococcus sp.]|nr:MAG: hypothetical protein DHS20C05_02770 [Marinicaulis sp.]
MKKHYLLGLLPFLMSPALAEDSLAPDDFGKAKPLRPVATYSIVARDAETGEMGVAVQSHWFSVGSIVSWAEAGVGAVATQAFVEPAYGPWGLDAMRKGKAADKTLEKLIAKDENENVRQVAFVDAEGRIGAHTGAKSIIESCDQQGEAYSVQANLMDKETVCAAMAAAFEASEGDLAERMMAALEGAQSVGGDIRGKQSAAMIVVEGTRKDNPWEGRVIDLRIEDHETPLAELRRLITLNRAYNLMNEGDALVTDGDMDAANKAYEAASALAPDNHEMVFWRAVTLASIGEVEASLPLFKEAFDAWPLWRELIPRLPHSDILPDDDALIAQILSVE